MEVNKFQVFVVLALARLTQFRAQQLDCSSCPVEETLEVVDADNVACSFKQETAGQHSFCNYEQSCVQASAGTWVQTSDWIEVTGNGSDYTAFSTLRSPQFHVQNVSCLRFHFAQTLPSKLTVIVNDQCAFPGVDKQQSDFGLDQVELSPGNITVEFRAQNLAEDSTWVRLKDVTLQEGSCPEIVMWGKVFAASVVAILAFLLAKRRDSTVPLSTSVNATYDYIIVGAGSAGCVLANRLTEDGDVTVLLVEAGGDDRGNEQINTPAMAGFMHHTDLDWDLRTRGYCSAGRVLGGSSSTNYMVWTRGHPHDYDHWAEQGCEGWSFKDVLPYFIKSEDGAREMGLELMDSNADGKDGVALVHNTIHKGERYSAARAYLHPVLHRKNLHVAANSFVTKVVFEGKRAMGVEMIRNNRKQVVKARREIAVKQDLPVGENLQNHINFPLQLGLKTPLGGATAGDFRSLWAWLQLRVFGSGPLSQFGVESHMFLSTSEDNKRRQWWDIQTILLAGVWNSDVLASQGYTNEAIADASRREQLKNGFLCLSSVLRPRSKGTVRLKSSDPFDDPLIDHNYLDDPEDLATLVRGINVCLDLINTPSLKAVGAEVADAPTKACVADGQEFASQEYWTCLARRNLLPAYHNVGTCKMGGASDDTAVVDPKLRVRGVSNVRVVDCSVMPTIPAGNTNGPVVMLAEKAADIIRHG
ncbi:hypothetical protein BaRGS_00008299 [Batillaria attramentaria]|uniref:Uncharacterized protein n=1 Tax=Batillaria attramentaria TaxID=370345 RepID=A0ABD0LM10_9CAEN